MALFSWAGNIGISDKSLKVAAMSSINLNQQQTQAIRAATAWAKTPLKKSRKQIFRLFGFAGTGKTTLAKIIAENFGGKSIFCAYTGKASLVLRSKGCEGARTIHSLIYNVEEGSDGKPQFTLNEESPLQDIDLIIVDEVSMINKQLGSDLLSFGKLVLALGDPFQLPPVESSEGSTGFFDTDTPDVMLTDVERQAKDNPIIYLSKLVRENQPIRNGHYGTSKIITRKELMACDVMNADQVLVGRNTTRQNCNDRVRQLKMFEEHYPQESERLICLKNNTGKGLLNGGQWSVKRSDFHKVNVVDLELISLDNPEITDELKVSVPIEWFTGKEQFLSAEMLRKDQFTYGYAQTVNKAQGSQWDSVVLIDESYCFRKYARRHLYTGITRAAENIVIAQ